jgi:F0F1-type ATP synthase delta subunit
MSIGKSLAEKYLKKDFSEFESVLSKVGSFSKNFKKLSETKDFYNICKIYSSSKISDEEIQKLKNEYNIPSDVKTETYIDENVLGGIVVYYQGKKWDGSMRGIFNRFNEM